jgi:hypothetical protein
MRAYSRLVSSSASVSWSAVSSPTIGKIVLPITRRASGTDFDLEAQQPVR